MTESKQIPDDAKLMRIPDAIALAADHQQAGRLARAENVCRQILQATPDDPDALHLMGVITHSKGNVAAAIELIKRAIAGDARKSLYHSNLGEIYRRLGRTPQAVASGRRAMMLDPKNAQVLNNFGIALHDHREFAESEVVLRKALALHPSYADAHSNLGNAIRGQHRLAEAVPWYRRAVELKPDFADALANLGTTLKDIGEYDEAMTFFDRAIAVDPKHANAHSARALLLLLRGDYPEGWREFEWRWLSTEMRPRSFVQPAWRGEKLVGQRLLVHGEQGMGDSLHFCRYLPLLRESGGELIFEVHPPLARLMAANYPWLRIVPQGTLTPFDQHCALISLALMAGTTVATIPASVPYLRPDPAAAARWAARFADLPLRVGFAWSGNPAHRNDYNRSMAIEHLAPLFDVPGVTFMALQVGDRAADLKRLTNFGSGLDLSAELGDFAETAAVVANLDLVIAVDTAIVHLVGALAKPAWVMLPQVPDWRWMLEREDNPWYPTVRLFRQPTAGDWAPVVARVADELRAVADGQRERLLPRP
jgi:Tfp pilus assembly protein PilF